jgi:hypothetical protein
LQTRPYRPGDIVPVAGHAAQRRQPGDSGPVTAAFFAHAEGWGDWYIGSAFFADIAPGATCAGRRALGHHRLLRHDAGQGGGQPVWPGGGEQQGQQHRRDNGHRARPDRRGAGHRPAHGSTAGQGQRASVDIVVRTDQPVDGAAAYLDFDRSEAAGGVDHAGRRVERRCCKIASTTLPGTLAFAAGVLATPPSADFVLATVTFTATALTPGTPLTFASLAPRRSDM